VQPAPCNVKVQDLQGQTAHAYHIGWYVYHWISCCWVETAMNYCIHVAWRHWCCCISFLCLGVIERSHTRVAASLKVAMALRACSLCVDRCVEEWLCVSCTCLQPGMPARVI